jgi:hypothetical protein
MHCHKAAPQHVCQPWNACSDSPTPFPHACRPEQLRIEELEAKLLEAQDEVVIAQEDLRAANEMAALSHEGEQAATRKLAAKIRELHSVQKRLDDVLEGRTIALASQAARASAAPHMLAPRDAEQHNLHHEAHHHHEAQHHEAHHHDVGVGRTADALVDAAGADAASVDAATVEGLVKELQAARAATSDAEMELANERARLEVALETAQAELAALRMQLYGPGGSAARSGAHAAPRVSVSSVSTYAPVAQLDAEAVQEAGVEGVPQAGSLRMARSSVRTPPLPSEHRVQHVEHHAAPAPKSRRATSHSGLDPESHELRISAILRSTQEEVTSSN